MIYQVFCSTDSTNELKYWNSSERSVLRPVLRTPVQLPIKSWGRVSDGISHGVEASGSSSQKVR